MAEPGMWMMSLSDAKGIAGDLGDCLYLNMFDYDA